MKYDAFISYRHTPLDMEMAKKIHAGLETFKVPRAVQKLSGKKNIKRVFRDQEELPIGSDLSNNISAALENSEFLLVICSPNTPESYWCAKEIDTFIEMHDQNHVLAVLIDGEPGESFPPRLLTDKDGNPVEPLAADVRGITPSERKKKLKTELMRLAAPILGCTYDDLRQRHRERRIKRIASFVTLGAAVLMVIGIAFGIYNARIAKEMTLLNEEISKNYTAKQINQSKFLATTSKELLKDGNREDAVLVALQALPGVGEERPYVPEAQYALSNALYIYSDGSDLEVDGQMVHDLAVYDFKYNTDGTKIVSRDSGNNVYVWDVASKELLVKIPAPISDYGYREKVEAFAMNEDVVFVCYDTHYAAYGVDGSLMYSKPLEGSVSYASYYETEDLGFLCFLSSLKVISLSTGEEMANVMDPFDSNLSSQMAYFGTSKLFAETLYIKEEDPAGVALFDFSGTDVNAIFAPVTGGYVMRMCFTPDGNLCVLSTDADAELISASLTVYVDLISPSGELLWNQTEEVSISNVSSYSSNLKAHKVTEGLPQSEIVLSLDNHLMTFLEDTGEKIVNINVSDSIVSLILQTSDSWAYVAQQGGQVDFVNTATGRVYSDLFENSTIDISKMDIRNSTLTVRSYSSSALTIYSYHTGPSTEPFAELSDVVIHSFASPSGDVICFESGVGDTLLYFYDLNGTLLSKVSLDEYDELSDFIFDDTFAYVVHSKEIIFINPKDGSMERKSFELDGFGMDGAVFSANRKFMLAWEDENFIVYDLENKKTVATHTASADIADAFIDDTGDYVAYVTVEGGSFDCRLSLGEETEFAGTNLSVLSDMVGRDVLDVSPDLQFAAVVCADGFLRIVDLKTHEVVNTLEFQSQLRSFVYFTKDSKHLIAEGENCAVKVLDLETQTIVGTYDENFGTISKAWENEESGMLVLVDGYALFLFDEKELSPIGKFTNGKLYSAKENALYADDYGNVSKARILTIGEIMDEVKNQFPNSILTEDKKSKYCID